MKERNTFRADEHLDAALQKELDEALGGMSLEDIIQAEEAPAAPAGAPLAKGLRRGKVVSVNGPDIFVDLGGKSQGILPVAQFEDQPLPAEGDFVEVTIQGYDGREGLLLLSRQGAVLEATWETLAEGTIVEGRVVESNKGGLELDINGLRAFMPISHIELFRVEDLTPYLNQRMKCQVVEANESDRKLVVSRRSILELEAAENREKAFAALTEGKTVRGTVRSIMPYGAFVDIGGVDGLLHISDMAYSRVEDPNTVVKVGQALEVMVLKIDRETKRVGLGLKQVMPDPWQGAEAKWPIGDLVSGRVTRLADFGAFIELEEGVEGLLPISEITFERRINHPSEIVKVGDVVRVRVLSMDLQKKRISLSLKRAGEDPWMGASARWPANSLVQGAVKRLAEFGAFVEIVPGVEGLVHISEVSDQHVRSVGDVLSPGQIVQAKVLEVDEDRRRISLSIKQVSSNPEYTGQPEAATPEAPPPPAPKRKKPLKGGLE